MSREIESLRDHFRWNQSDLAQALGVSQGAVSDWERGKYLPSAETIIKLGNMAPGTEAALGFWKQAGLDVARALAAVGSILQLENVPATAEQLKKFPELDSRNEIGISTAERLLRLPTRTVMELVKSGKLKARRLGSVYLFDYGAVVDFSTTTRRKL